MRAIVARRYGSPDVLELRDVERPEPADDEVLIRVHATTATAGDCEFRRLDFPAYIRFPLRVYASLRHRSGLVLGQELAGEVESVGRDVTRFSTGERVFAPTLFRFGAYAEYACLPETYPIASKPADVSFEEAATIPVGGINGLHFLRRADVQAGDAVLVNGAGGSIGTYAVQIANVLGAEVTAVDRGEKLDLLRSIGADHVVDYTREDFAERGETYDAVVDVIGTSATRRRLDRLNEAGRYVLGNPSLLGRLGGLWITATTDHRVAFELASPRRADMEYLAGLVESRDVRPVVDRRYPLAEAAEAHRHVESGRKTGNVVLSVE